TAPTTICCRSTCGRRSGRGATQRNGCTRSRSREPAPPSPSTSGRRRSPRACASAPPPPPCAGSPRTTCARSGRSSSKRSTPPPTSARCAAARASSWPDGRSTRDFRVATRPTDQLVVIDHPLVQHKLALPRDVETNTKNFRHLMGELAAFLCYEATRDLELEEFQVQTPLEETPARRVS